MSSTIYSHQLNNGLTLVAEEMPWLQSAAFSLLLPAGAAHDPVDQQGLSNLLCDFVQRGAGTRDSRQLVEDLDNLGVARGANVTNSHTNFGGAVLADNLLKTLSIYAEMIQKPHLPQDQFDEAKLVCFQELSALADDLASQTMIGLRKQLYPDPFGRSAYGIFETVEKLTVAQAQSHYQRCYQPSKTILSVAGKFNWEELKAEVEKLFGEWDGEEPDEVTLGPQRSTYEHVDFDSQQTHLGIGFPSVSYANPDYFLVRGAIGVMSDGMAARLFMEVREKRGLCYTVYATCHTLKDRGSVLCYSGTSTERAQETLDVIIDQLELLRQGINQAELTRLKTRIKSALVMQQESSSSRAASIAADWFYLGYVRPLKELKEIIEGLTCDKINYYLEHHPPRNFHVSTIGAKPLELPRAISADNP